MKEAMLADDPDVFFTTAFNGHLALLMRLNRVAPAELGELIIEA